MTKCICRKNQQSWIRITAGQTLQYASNVNKIWWNTVNDHSKRIGLWVLGIYAMFLAAVLNQWFASSEYLNYIRASHTTHGSVSSIRNSQFFVLISTLSLHESWIFSKQRRSRLK